MRERDWLQTTFTKDKVSGYVMLLRVVEMATSLNLIFVSEKNKQFL